MALCFLCNNYLFSKRIRIYSRVAPHSKVPYLEKIAELLGDKFVVIATSADHICKKCSSLLTHMDKLENDINIIKNAVVSFIEKKNRMLSYDKPEETFDVRTI